MNALVVYSLPDRRARATLTDHLYSFRRHSRHRYVYVNLAVRRIPRALARARFDAIVFHTPFLSARSSDAVFEETMSRAAALKGTGGVRIALPQDEYVRTGLLARFIEEFEVDHVCSVAPESEWPKIYRGVDRERVRFHRVLTGYLEPAAVKRIQRLVKPLDRRPLDIGYRARRQPPRIGRQGILKGKLADEFEQAGRRRGLNVDLTTDGERVLLEEDWYRFLGSCKYTVGVEGGASLLDSDGSLMERTDRYLAERPGASFDEVEAACFPGRDGELSLVALGPRHLEACATRTCQILVEGDYNGILRPGEHYIELRADLSNLNQVLDEVERDEARAAIVEAAYRDVVASGAVSYERFVAEIEGLWTTSDASTPERSPRWMALAALARVANAASWAELALRRGFSSAVARAYPVVRRLLPRPAFRLLQRARARTVTRLGTSRRRIL